MSETACHYSNKQKTGVHTFILNISYVCDYVLKPVDTTYIALYVVTGFAKRSYTHNCKYREISLCSYTCFMDPLMLEMAQKVV